MTKGFLDHMRIVPDPRVPGMAAYPLDAILLSMLVCGADDWDGVEEVATGALHWRRELLPFEHGIAMAQTLRKGFRLLGPEALERGFTAWAASVRPLAREVIAVDGKTLRGSRQPDGGGALHLVSAYAAAGALEGIDGVGRHGRTKIGFKSLAADDVHAAVEACCDVVFQSDIIEEADMGLRIDLDHDVDIAVRPIIASGPRAEQGDMRHAARA